MSEIQAKDKSGKPNPAHEDRAKTDNSSNLKAFVSAFIKAKKDLLLYPASNPVVAESIEHMVSLLKEKFGESDAVEFLVEKDHLLVNGQAESWSGLGVESLSLSLYRMGARRIVIDPDIPFEEMRTLLEILNLKREEIDEAGGLTAFTRSKDLNHVFVEETAELTIVDRAGLQIADEVLSQLDDSELSKELGTPEGFGRMIIYVRDGDVAWIKRLRALLDSPELFSSLLEKFAVQVEEIDGDGDSVAHVERMLEVLHTVGAVIASLPSENERLKMTKNLTHSILDLPTNLRGELVSKGLVPNLALRAMESRILSHFPVQQLADALMGDFVMSGSTASVMQSYFSNLDFSHGDCSELAEALRGRLDEKDMLSQEVDAVLAAAELKPTTGLSSPAEREAMSKPVPQMDGYPPEKILFKGGERDHLKEHMVEELEAPAADVMVHALLEVFRHEESPPNHATLVGRARAYMERFLADRDYKSAALLIDGLQTEMEHKRSSFSGTQLKPIQNFVMEYGGENRIEQLIGTFKDLNKESPDFEELNRYFAAVGESATDTLLHALENKESRHVRLLICQSLARMGKEGMELVAERLNHPQWYVVRNAVAILGQIADPACVPYLEKALSHENIRVRKEALKGVASIRTDRAVELVCSCVNEKDVDMCKAALGWVAAMGMEQALPALERILGDHTIWKQREDVLRPAIEALESIDTGAARKLLKKLTGVRSLFRRRKAALIRETATAALNNIGGE